jgi:hypothetical protein
MLILGALNWAAEWWNPRRGSLDIVVRTAQSLVRHGLGIPQTAEDSQPPARKIRASKTTRSAG